MGKLLGLLAAQIVAVKIDALVRAAVRGEINLVIVPHGESVGALVVSYLLDGVGLEVINPDVLRHAARVALPGSEIAKDAVVSDLVAVRRERRQAALAQHEALGKSAIDAHAVKLPE